MSLKYLRSLSNERLLEAMEYACFHLVQKDTKTNQNRLANIEKVILERMEDKENV